ncbi:MAG: hypothetical protein WCH99_01660 [Verrucomicrobiota bacterium]
MQKESLLQIYVGNKLFGSRFPVLVVAGDNTWNKTHFGEHYFFTDFQKLPFVFRRDIVGPANARPDYFDFDAYPQIFSAESLMKNQFASARAHIEYTFSTLDMNAYKAIFWEGRPFEFTESDDYPLVQFHIWGNYQKEMGVMFEHSRSKKIRELKEKLSGLPTIKIEQDFGSKEV